MENLSVILNAILGGTSVVAIVGWFIYRKENRKLKQNEVKVSSADAQRQEIELAELYKDKMLAMMEQMSEKQDSGNENQHRILDKLDRLEDKVEGIENYLNGPYHKWLAEKEKGDENGTIEEN